MNGIPSKSNSVKNDVQFKKRTRPNADKARVSTNVMSTQDNDNNDNDEDVSSSISNTKKTVSARNNSGTETDNNVTTITTVYESNRTVVPQVSSAVMAKLYIHWGGGRYNV